MQISIKDRKSIEVPMYRLTFRRTVIWLGSAVAALLLLGFAVAYSQQLTKAVPPPKALGRFEFEVIQCFDARYLGDTPGYTGRHGELGDQRPQAALGDPVYRGDVKIGKVSGLTWSQGHGSLEIEFDAEPNVRISVGDVVWLTLEEKR